MFLDNEWTKRYMKLMDSRKRMNRKRVDCVVLHNHHIIPKSMGGSNKQENMVLLTPREHFIAHLMLTKMTTGRHYRGMVYAAVRFLGDNKSMDINSRTYSYIQEMNMKLSLGENNPFYGKKHSKQTIESMKEKLIDKMVGTKNPFYGKTHNYNVRKVISENSSKRIRVTFDDDKMLQFRNRKEFADYMGWDKSMVGALIINPRRRSKYSITNIEVDGGVDYSARKIYCVRTNTGETHTFGKLKEVQEFYNIKNYDQTRKLFSISSDYSEERRIKANKASNNGYSIFQVMKDKGIVEAWSENKKDR